MTNVETSPPPPLHHLHMAPTSTVGRWCAGFGSSFLIAIAIEFALAASQRAGQEDSAWMRGAAIVALGSIIAGLASGVIAVARRHDRSLVVLAVVGIGVLVILFELGELVTSD